MKKALIQYAIGLAFWLSASPGWAGSWTSSSVLAYNAMGHSSTGFAKATGSALFFDIQRSLSPAWHIGLRTTALGARSHQGQLYRLAAGPVLRFSFWSQWAVKLSVGFFNESAEESGSELYRSKGRSLQFGWERSANLNQVVSVAWGGFIGKHWGNLHQVQKQAAIPSSSNIGDYRGLQISLRISL